MQKRIATLVITMAVSLAIMSSVTAADLPCRELDGMKPQHQLTYLQADRSKLSPACIVSAIKQLGRERFAGASDTLAAYLDFRMPGTENQDQGGLVINRLPWVGDKYPAANALYEIGIKASPSLVRVIVDGTSDLLRNNALEVLVAVHRENIAEAVGLLSAASRMTLDTPTSNRLWETARRVASKCPADLRARCEEARLDHN